MGAKGTYLSWIMVNNLKETRKFFTEVLGFKEKSYDEQWQWAEFVGTEGGGIVGVSEKNDFSEIPAGANAVLTFTVDDIEQAKKDFKNKGITLVGDTMEVPGHVKLQSFKDKDGNYFQLVQTLE